MTKSFYIIFGLPGAGKTTLANELVKHYSSSLVLDDIGRVPANDVSKNLRGFEAVAVTVAPTVSITKDRFVELRDGLSNVAREAGYEPFVICLYTAPDECYSRVKQRNDGRTISKEFIYEMSLKYNALFT